MYSILGRTDPELQVVHELLRNVGYQRCDIPREQTQYKLTWPSRIGQECFEFQFGSGGWGLSLITHPIFSLQSFIAA